MFKADIGSDDVECYEWEKQIAWIKKVDDFGVEGFFVHAQASMPDYHPGIQFESNAHAQALRDSHLLESSAASPIF